MLVPLGFALALALALLLALLLVLLVLLLVDEVRRSLPVAGGTLPLTSAVAPPPPPDPPDFAAVSVEVVDATHTCVR